jgi:hypothetical protein
MKTTKLLVPSIMSDLPCVDFIHRLGENIDVPNVQILFKHVEFARPTGALMVSVAIRKYVETRKAAGLKTFWDQDIRDDCPCSDAVKYLKYMGFFKDCGIPVGSESNRSRHTDNYYPVQRIEKKKLAEGSSGGDWRDSIEQKCQSLSALISDDLSTQVFLDYVFREIIRNVFEHSGADSCSLMAQNYKNEGLEIAVADHGIGIHDSLRTRHGFSSARESIQRSLEPGISKEDVFAQGDSWANSGFGLYVMSEVGRTYGEFSVLSSGVYLRRRGNDQTMKVIASHYRGTVVKLLVGREKLEYFPNLMEGLIREGENLYKEKYGSEIKASRSSRTLSRKVPDIGFF